MPGVLTPGTYPPNGSPCKGDRSAQSVPNVSLVKTHAVLPQKSPDFFLERQLTMVHLLIHNVVDDALVIETCLYNIIVLCVCNTHSAALPGRAGITTFPGLKPRAESFYPFGMRTRVHRSSSKKLSPFRP
jgi:hypothetical protein